MKERYEMKARREKIPLLISILLMLFVIGACSKVSNTEPELKYSISGKVTQEITNDPVIGQTVYLWDYQQETEFSAQSNDNGIYAFDELIEGNYLVSCKETEDYSFTPPEQHIEIVNEDITGIDFVRHNRKHSISGRISEEITNDPVADQTVLLWDYQEEVEFSVSSSQYGYYSFDELSEGNYKVYCEETEGYYFTPDEEYIELGNEDITGIDFVRHSCQNLHSISGKVMIREQGQPDRPFINHEIYLLNEYDLEQETHTDTLGQYFFEKLLNGSYRVAPYGYHFEPPFIDIEIEDEDIIGVDFLAFP